MSAQIIEKNGQPEWAVIPYDEYLRMLNALEDKVDAKTIEDTLADLAAGKEELIPAEIVERLLAENPYRVWREYRGFTLQEVANAAGVSRAYISMLESGDRDNPSRDVQEAIARKLSIDPDDLE